MKNKIVKFVSEFNKPAKSTDNTAYGRKDLETKVSEATKKAVTDYSKTLKILAEYDRT